MREKFSSGTKTHSASALRMSMMLIVEDNIEDFAQNNYLS